MDYSEICYKKTVLSQVIVRLDFYEYVEESELFSDNIEMVIMNSFPQKGKQQVVRFQLTNLTINPTGTLTENSYREGVQRVYSDNSGNRLILSNRYAIWEINKYTSYENISLTIDPILKILFECAAITVIRTGIRYINEFNNDTIKPKKSFFNIPVSALLDSKVSLNNCIRMMNTTEYVLDDMRLNFRYGLFNPHYPQILKAMQFVLDFDCFYEGIINAYSDVVDHIIEGHDGIQLLFEQSITDALRKVMNCE